MSKHIHTEIDIESPPKVVWEILTDLDSYQDWNPYHVRVGIDGDLVAGRRLVVQLSKPNGTQLTIKPHVIRMEPERELTWGGGIKGIFSGEHRFILEPTGFGTRLVHSEDFRGLVVRYAALDSIEEGYELMNRALKSHAEARAHESSRR